MDDLLRIIGFAPAIGILFFGIGIKRKFPDSARRIVQFVAITSMLGMAVILSLIGILLLRLPALPGSAESVSIDSHETLKLFGAREQQVVWHIDGPISVNSFWAAPQGITLTLKNPSTGFSVKTLTNPSTQDTWGSRIEGSPPSNTIVIDGSFAIPSVPGSEVQTLTGNLTGNLFYPQAANGGFEDESTDFTIPVQLQIVSPSQARQLESDRQSALWQEFLPNVELLILGYCVMVPLAFITRACLEKKKGRVIKRK